MLIRVVNFSRVVANELNISVILSKIFELEFLFLKSCCDFSRKTGDFFLFLAQNRRKYRQKVLGFCFS